MSQRRFGGRAGIEAFSETRWITLQTEERHYPFLQWQASFR